MIGSKYKDLIVENYWTKSNGDLELVCLNPHTGIRTRIIKDNGYERRVYNQRISDGRKRR